MTGSGQFCCFYTGQPFAQQQRMIIPLERVSLSVASGMQPAHSVCGVGTRCADYIGRSCRTIMKNAQVFIAALKNSDWLRLPIIMGRRSSTHFFPHALQIGIDHYSR
jgi:hypothetical protein